MQIKTANAPLPRPHVFCHFAYTGIACSKVSDPTTHFIDTDAVVANGGDPIRETLQHGENAIIRIGDSNEFIDYSALLTAAAYAGAASVEFIGNDNNLHKSFNAALTHHERQPPNLEAAKKIAATLKRDPVVSQLLKRNPELVLGWTADYWVDPLLNGVHRDGAKWPAHDIRRPQPPKFEPGVNACPSTPKPANAESLLSVDGHFAFEGEHVNLWTRTDGQLTPSGEKNNRISSRSSYRDMHLHLEFRMPKPVQGHGQHRGNSGIFLMGLYEIQILDSFENPTSPDGQLGALYGQTPPSLNASLPPGAWQCLDIIFSAPRFEGDLLIEPAHATVIHNGVVIQANTPFFGPTTFNSIREYRPHQDELPFTLQDHGDAGSKVTFRNIWSQRISAM